MKIEVEISDDEVKKLVRELLIRKIYDYIDYRTPVQSLTMKILTDEVKKHIKRHVNDYLKQVNIHYIIEQVVQKYLEVADLEEIVTKVVLQKLKKL